MIPHTTITTPKYVKVSEDCDEYVEIEDKIVGWFIDQTHTIDFDIDMNNYIESEDFEKPRLVDEGDANSFVDCFIDNINEALKDSEEIQLLIGKAYEEAVSDFNKHWSIIEIKYLEGLFMPYSSEEEVYFLEKEFCREAKKQNKTVSKTVRFNDGKKTVAFSLEDKEEEVEENEDFETDEYRYDIETGCPEGHITIWSKYRFDYKKLEDCSKEELIEYMKKK